MAHRLAPGAEAELDDIWFYIARESDSTEIADRVIDTITDRFFLLATYPPVGRRRTPKSPSPFERLGQGDTNLPPTLSERATGQQNAKFSCFFSGIRPDASKTPENALANHARSV